ncbi:MAG: AMP-binding protein, partial [Gammaproteobacteria bacterium]|nr:AMP-binding protein [Gammaproteobacteria bacterium]
TDPRRWNERLHAAAVTTLSLTPSGLSQWLAAGCELPATVTRIVLSGEPVAAAVLADWFAHDASGRVALYSTYGLTETAGRVAWAQLTGVADAGVVGQATPDAELRLLDSETLTPVAPGCEAELFVGGPMLATGFLGDESAADARFVTADPDGAGLRRWYRTGDLATQGADGVFFFKGRNDAQVKVRGHRVDAGALEQLLQSHPDVAAAAVVQSDNSKLTAFVVPADARQGEPPAVEFWPSLGEYQIYDALLYDFMSADETRIAAYRAAFEKQVQGKVALDIGTGKDAVLARLCAQAGARHVYAVEVLEDAADSARELINRLGLTDRITVICGDMQSIRLPEPVDLCTQGIIGNIGSSDGIVPIWNQAQQFFAADVTAVPATCTTLIAPVRLPDEIRDHPEFTALAADYTQRVFAAEGREFDVRLCVRNFPADALLAEPVVFEQLDFRAAGNDALLSADYTGSASFTINEPGWLDGYVLWTRIAADAETEVDFLQHQQAWLPVFFPLGEHAVRLSASARIDTSWECTTRGDQIFPDYTVTTAVPAAADDAGSALTLSYRTRHHESALGATELHRRLHESLRSASDDGRGALQQWLAAQLPGYMVPEHIRHIGAMPLTANRKLNRQQLIDMAAASAVQDHSLGNASELLTADPLEQAVARIWADVLGTPVGLDGDFFAAGGDSIIAVRLTTEVQRFLDDAVFLSGLYDAPDVRSYANWLREHHGPAVERALVGIDAATDEAGSNAAAITPAPDGPLPLTYAQQSLWFLQQLYPGNTAANEQFLLRFTGIEKQRVAAAWAELVERHDVLRTTFSGSGTDVLQQHVAAVGSPAAKLAAELAGEQDFRHTNDPSASLRHLAASEIVRSFDLQSGPLLRPVYVRLSTRESVLLVTAHHIVADGLCVPLIQRALHTACTGGQIDPPAVQFGDFASWQRRTMSGDRLAGEVEWWCEKLAGATLDPVPATRSEASATGPESRIPLTINRELARALRAFA